MYGRTLVPYFGCLTSQPPGFLGNENALAGPGVPVKGASAYPGVIITTCTSHLGTVERVTSPGSYFNRNLFHVGMGRLTARDKPNPQVR